MNPKLFLLPIAKQDGSMARLRCFSFSRSSLTDHGCDHYVTGCGEAET